MYHKMLFSSRGFASFRTLHMEDLSSCWRLLYWFAPGSIVLKVRNERVSEREKHRSLTDLFKWTRVILMKLDLRVLMQGEMQVLK